MLRLLTTIFLISAGVFIYSYFRDLNPDTIIVHASSTTEFELSPVTLVLISMAAGSVFVAFVVGLQQTAHAIVNWRSNRQVRRKEDVIPALEEMLAHPGPYVLDVLVPYQEHVLPMIPAGGTVRDIIKS